MPPQGCGQERRFFPAAHRGSGEGGEGSGGAGKGRWPEGARRHHRGDLVFRGGQGDGRPGRAPRSPSHRARSCAPKGNRPEAGDTGRAGPGRGTPAVRRRAKPPSRVRPSGGAERFVDLPQGPATADGGRREHRCGVGRNSHEARSRIAGRSGPGGGAPRPGVQTVRTVCRSATHRRSPILSSLPLALRGRLSVTMTLVGSL